MLLGHLDFPIGMNSEQIKELTTEAVKLLNPSAVEDMFIGFSQPFSLDGFRLFVRKEIVNPESLDSLNAIVADCGLEIVDNLKDGYWTIKTRAKKSL